MRVISSLLECIKNRGQEYYLQKFVLVFIIKNAVFQLMNCNKMHIVAGGRLYNAFHVKMRSSFSNSCQCFAQDDRQLQEAKRFQVLHGRFCEAAFLTRKSA